MRSSPDKFCDGWTDGQTDDGEVIPICRHYAVEATQKYMDDIMPPDAKQAVNLLNYTRQSVRIATFNPYIFERVNSNSPLSDNTELK
jgi:hypothetical protein